MNFAFYPVIRIGRMFQWICTGYLFNHGNLPYLANNTQFLEDVNTDVFFKSIKNRQNSLEFVRLMFIKIQE